MSDEDISDQDDFIENSKETEVIDARKHGGLL